MLQRRCPRSIVGRVVLRAEWLEPELRRLESRGRLEACGNEWSVGLDAVTLLKRAAHGRPGSGEDLGRHTSAQKAASLRQREKWPTVRARLALHDRKAARDHSLETATVDRLLEPSER